MEVIQNRPARVTVVLTDSSTGSEKTGVVPGDITLYYRKAGALTAVNKVIDASNFREVDATNLPGLYEILFTADELSARGEFVAVIHANGAVDLAQQNLNLTVIENPQDMVNDQTEELVESHREHSEFIGFLPPTGDDTIYAYFQHKGEPVKGLTGDDEEMQLAMVNSSSNTSVSNWNPFMGNWTEIDSFGHAGWYRFDMPGSWKPDEGDFGHLRFAPLNYLRGGHQSSYTFDVNDVYGCQISDGSYKGLFTVGFSTGAELGYYGARVDGVNWSTDSIAGRDLYAVDGDGTVDNVIAVGSRGAVYEWDGSDFIYVGSWETSGTNFWDVSYYDTSNIWMCGTDELIYHYDGTTPTSQNSGGTKDLHSIHAINDQLVYAAGGDLSNGAILMLTEDGGTIWTDVTSRIPDLASNDWFQSITFDQDQPNRGVIAVATGSGSTTSKVYYTEDSGRTWEAMAFEVPSSTLVTGADLNAERVVVVGQDMTTGGSPRPPVVYETESLGTKWTKVAVHDTTADVKSVFCAPDDSLTYLGAGNGEVLQTPADTVRFDPVNLRFYVASIGSTDLSPVLADLDAIKGGFYWNSSTDSLPALSDAIGNINVDLSPVLDDLTAIKGPNFNTNVDSLSERVKEIPFSGTLAQSNSATITVRIGERTGLTPSDLEAELYKDGMNTSTNLLSTWQEVDDVNAPGVYRFTLTNVDTDTLGDLLVRISRAVPENLEVFEWTGTPSGSSLEGTNEANSLGTIEVVDSSTIYVGLYGDALGEQTVYPEVYTTANGGDSWSSVYFNQMPPRYLKGLGYDATTNTVVILGENSSGNQVIYYGTPSGGLFPTANPPGTYFDNGGAPMDLAVTNDGAGNPIVYFTATDSGSESYVMKWDGSTNTFSTIRTGTTEGYIGVYAVDDQTLIVTGADTSGNPYPVIYKTTNGGSSWTSVFSHVDADLYEQALYIDFDDTNTYGYATGLSVDVSGPTSFSLTIYRTADGGDTWTRSIPTENGSPIPYQSAGGVHVVDQDTLVFASFDTTENSGAILWKSEDQGATATQITLEGLTSGTIYGLDGDGVDTFGVINMPSSLDNSVFHYGYGETYTPMDDVTLRFDVADTSSASVDLTPVTDSLDEIKGATFDGNTDSLEQIRDNLSSVDLSPVTATLDDIKGTGFDTSTDSLKQIRDNSGADLTPVTDSLDDIKGATFNTSTDSLEEIRNNLSNVDLSPVTASLDDIKGSAFDVNENSLAALSGDVSGLQMSMARVLGLSQENVRITGQTYDSSNNLIESTITLYPTAADVTAETNPIAAYQLSASYDTQGRLVDYSIKKV